MVASLAFQQGRLRKLAFQTGPVVERNSLPIVRNPYLGQIPRRGQIAGTLDTQTVQHLDGGVIQKILVHEGQRVDTGETLLLLDATEDALHLDALENQLASLQARAARLAALRSGADVLTFPNALVAHADVSSDIREKLQAQRRLFAAERQTADETLTILDNRIDK